MPATESSIPRNTRQQRLILCFWRFSQVCFLEIFIDQTNPGVSCSRHLEVEFQGSGISRGECSWDPEKPEFTSFELLHAFWMSSLVYLQNGHFLGSCQIAGNKSLLWGKYFYIMSHRDSDHVLSSHLSYLKVTKSQRNPLGHYQEGQ